ncbi:MAG: hypothetical protein IJS45_04065 [Clostridia bacterium]|nr:hypothetical protein [Clostridia bacterium]
MAKKTIIYSDPVNDDFASTALNSKPVPSDFRFVIKNPLWRAAEFVCYRIIATPVVWIIGKTVFGLRIKNRRAVRKLRGTGCYLYGNHTQGMMDAYTPTLICFPRFAHVVVGPQSVSSPALRVPVQLLGGIPVPKGASGLRSFTKALSFRVGKGRTVAIYPEAHIWPWYTGIRSFPDASFTYPVRDAVPAAAFVTTYRRRKILKNLPPRLTITVSELFYPDVSLGERAARKKLRDQVYDFMCRETSSPDNYAYYEYAAAGPAESRDGAVLQNSNAKE